MKILVAPDSYKGSLSSKQVCQAIEEGLLKACQGVFEVVKVPIADGGEGTVDAFLSALGGQLIELPLQVHWASPCTAFYAFYPMAQL